LRYGHLGSSTCVLVSFNGPSNSDTAAARKKTSALPSRQNVVV
jgi:hypothetical protein